MVIQTRLDDKKEFMTTEDKLRAEIKFKDEMILALSVASAILATILVCLVCMNL